MWDQQWKQPWSVENTHTHAHTEKMLTLMWLNEGRWILPSGTSGNRASTNQQRRGLESHDLTNLTTLDMTWQCNKRQLNLDFDTSDSWAASNQYPVAPLLDCTCKIVVGLFSAAFPALSFHQRALCDTRLSLFSWTAWCSLVCSCRSGTSH